MEVTIRSADGTNVSARRRGDGPPIVVVHGTTGTINTFALVEAALAGQNTIWVYDRRGRGQSGDTEPYALEREVDDLLAVLDAAGPDAHLIGHSFGAVCALLAATRQPRLRTVTLYEPPLRLDRADQRAFNAAVRHLAGANYELGLPMFFSLAGITAEETASMRAIPDVWAGVCDGARRAPRELLALTSSRWSESAFETVKTPILLLSGSQTRSGIYPSPAEFRQVIPNANSAALARQGHLGFAFDPPGFVQAVLAFTTAHDASPL